MGSGEARLGNGHERWVSNPREPGALGEALQPCAESSLGAAASLSPVQPAQRDGGESGRRCAEMGMGSVWQKGLNR